VPRYTLKGVGPPFPKQQKLIDYLFESAPDETKQVDLCCGRGYGKSVIAIDIACRALSRSPNEIGLFLEPDWKRTVRVFLKKWKKIVPKELYALNKGEQCITWINGAMLFYGPRNITGSQEMSDDSQVGEDTTFVIDDEAALRCSSEGYNNRLVTVREPSDARFYLTVSTPRVGPYQRLVTSPGHVMFRGKSTDNPYLPKNYVENLRANMSAEQAKRELDGEFVTLRGRIWKTAKPDVAWPDGNRNDDHTGFVKDQAWWLFCDIGSATGAYAVVQAMDPIHNGVRIPNYHGKVWVAVADFCPNDDASASRVFQKMDVEFGRPNAVIGGSDMNSRDKVAGETVSYFARQIWKGIDTYTTDESVYSRQIQYDRMNFLMCAANQTRRFTIAKNFVSMDAESRRGVREMILEDAWPPIDRRREGDFLPKNRNIVVQHIRDALLAGAVNIMAKPEWGHATNPAA